MHRRPFTLIAERLGVVCTFQFLKLEGGTMRSIGIDHDLAAPSDTSQKSAHVNERCCTVGHPRRRALWRSKRIWTSAVSLAAASAFLWGVSGAAASVPKLVFTQGGIPVSGKVGTAVNLTAADGGEPSCGIIYYESQLINKRPRDPISLVGFSRATCAGSAYTLTAHFSKIVFVWNGEVIIHGDATIAGPGPCVYSFKSLIASLEIPGQSLTGDIPVQGALKHNESNISCAPLETLNLEINFDTGAGEFPHSELWG